MQGWCNNTSVLSCFSGLEVLAVKFYCGFAMNWEKRRCDCEKEVREWFEVAKVYDS